MEQYARIRVLGEGSFGNVYLMREKRDGGVLVCVKDIPIQGSETCHESLNEAKLMQKLHHPNIIEYRDSLVSRNQKHLYIVMQYCSGGMFMRVLLNVFVTFSWINPISLLS
jgi:NIMA (never in mitosis gene a)-related kinase